MVDTQTQHSRFDLELMTEAQLEEIIAKHSIETPLGKDARFVLGRLLVEGTNPEQAKRNEKKGLNWIKDVVKTGYLPALEYKTYYDIRFDRHPKLEKIEGALYRIVDEAKDSTRAANTLAEFSHAQNSKADHKEKAAKFYQMSADQGCIIGTHWMGVFYIEGFGVPKNLDKAEANLIKAYKAGNSQSAFYLHLLYRDGEKKDVQKAYKYLARAVEMGITYFDQLHKFFTENYDVLAPAFIALKKPPSTVDQSKQTEISNMHEAYVNELKTTFTNALGKDRMYMRPCGYVTDQQIWMIGVLMKYMLKHVLHFSHSDFLQAMRIDLGPLLGDTGLWALKNYQSYQGEKGNEDKKKKARVCIELITNYLENGLDVLSKEAKFNLVNRYGPKKQPTLKQARADIPILYSWTHYAPLAYLEALRKREEDVENAKNNKTGASPFSLCSYCGAPESQTMKHKRCSQCKQRLYCSVDCQKFDWKKDHKSECKTLAAQAKK